MSSGVNQCLSVILRQELSESHFYLHDGIREILILNACILLFCSTTLSRSEKGQPLPLELVGISKAVRREKGESVSRNTRCIYAVCRYAKCRTQCSSTLHMADHTVSYISHSTIALYPHHYSTTCMCVLCVCYVCAVCMHTH